MTNSVSPDGEEFRLPEDEDYRQEYEKLESLVKKQREMGREIVCRNGPWVCRRRHGRCCC